ncbi:Integrin alpha-3 [Thelohanellus kitauei]|uniref:Integrin alpha-3 n=1 Tax=Thelohanellus kitauei TaxID=669202 RepID=A0A0C2N3E6_THEKT|nr:Integrin alpha-3 [Thelohanellus kitauei]
MIDWIPTVGFDIGILFPQKTVRTNTEGTASEVVDTGAASAGITDVDDAKTEGLVVATNDDDAQKGRLFIYKFPLDHELAIPHLTISDDNDWQPFANFGNKIIIMDINKDGKNDLLVTAPTSKWNDLPEVGHVHLFMNTGSDPFSTSKSFIIRGEPIAHSFFGWNAESAGDLDGDGVNGENFYL